MHIHHDHIAGGAHDHEHTHSHTHEHTHDGVTHTHSHDHAHTHDHAHPHDHDHLHDHGHAHTHSHDHDCGGHCGSCAGGCEHTPMEELVALMKYMVGHNAAHAKELADLAYKLDEVGSHMAYHKVMDAVACFEQGNNMLSEVLHELGE